MDLRVLIRLLGLLLASSSALSGAAPASAPAWQGTVEIATGRGERGPWRQSQSRFDYVDDPAVALDERGHIAVAWVDQKRKAVLFQRYAADGSTPAARPVDVSRRPQTFSWLPRVAIAPDAPDRIFVLWQEIIFSGGSHGGDILFARSGDGGRTFSAPVNLSNSPGGDGKGRINPQVWHNGSLDLAAGPGGALYVAWTEYQGTLWFARSGDAGKSFSRPARVPAAAGAPARAPALALGPGGTLYLAWTVGEDDGADIHVARSADGGRTFDGPRVVAPSRTYSDAPRLAVDGAGVLHLAWAESAGGPFDRHHIRYTRSADGARSFEPAREISRPMPQRSVSAGFPALAVDGAGRVYVLWELYAQRGQPPRGLALAVSGDGGDSFAGPAMVPGSADAAGGFNGSSQGLTNKLAVNRRGAIAIVNSSLKADSHSRVWLMRGAMPR